MGKAKRKINRLRRKMLNKKIRPRVPVPPVGCSMKTIKDYDRKKMKKETKEMVETDV